MSGLWSLTSSSLWKLLSQKWQWISVSSWTFLWSLNSSSFVKDLTQEWQTNANSQKINWENDTCKNWSWLSVMRSYFWLLPTVYCVILHLILSFNFSKISCPDKNHKMHKHQKCSICDENLAYDQIRSVSSFNYVSQFIYILHPRKVHAETDRRRRQHIMKYLHPLCFPSW